MKIDSSFWKAKLLPAVERIQQLGTFTRYSERLADEFEREIMLAVFCVRTLFERRKLSEELLAKRYATDAFPKKTKKPVTWLNNHDIPELYDLNKPEPIQIDPIFLCNQIIHSYTLIPVKGGHGFSDILVCSDFERNRYLYLISVEVIIKLLTDVASDAPSKMQMTYNPKRLDYDIKNYITERAAAPDR